MLFFRQIFPYSALLTVVYCLPTLAVIAEQETIESQLQCPTSALVPITNDTVQVTNDDIIITSKYSIIEKDKIAKFSGDVRLVDKNQSITANQLTFDRLLMEFNAQGNIHYQNQSIGIVADELNASKDEASTVMLNTSYQLNGSPGHGSAGELEVNPTDGLSLLDSTYTTCIGDDPDWQIKASEIEISADGHSGEAYHAQVRLFDIPVLYLPYFSFPVSNQRRSGFLYPEIRSSSNSGLEIETPFYWNIAPAIDATITPHYMSKRGLQLKTEFRYLTDLQSGNINLEYLNKDDALTSNDDARYLARLQHIGTFSDDFRAYIDYTTLSDDNYLVDIGSKEYNSNDAYLYQIGELSYFGENWKTTIKIQDFEILGDHDPSYKTLPHIDILALQPFSLFSNQLLQGQFELYSELTNFKADTNQQVSANRYHVESGLNFPISTPAWFFNSEFKLMHTYYQQSDIQVGSGLEKNVDRTLPKIRFHGGINFDKSLSLFGNSYTHTIEPQVQYLYIPEKDQTEIGLYDTTNLQDDYNGLFREKIYSGLDRIAGANQYTWGLTSRLLDQSNLEIFRLSVGRIQYLSDDNQTFDEIIDIDNSSGSALTGQQSSLAANLFYRLNQEWQISSDIQYNTKESFTNKSQMALNYKIDKYNSIQLNHRYTRNVSGSSLEQASILAGFAINKDWAFVGRHTEDLQHSRGLESYLGLQYESCCWAIRLAYHRYINSNLSDDGENRDEFNSGFVLQFIIKGLNGEQGPIGTQKMFDSSIFGYKRPYYLQN